MYLLSLVFLFTPNAIAGPTASLSHCKGTEISYFNCQTKNRKIISLCGSADLSKSTGYIQYRFGKPKKVELEYPKDQKNSAAKFFYVHYSRSRTDYSILNFTNENTSYSVFDNSDEDSKPKSGAGVTISSEGKLDTHLNCKKPVISQLEKLKNIAACDPDDALNMNQCK